MKIYNRLSLWLLYMTKIREVWENKYKRINVKNNRSVTFLNLAQITTLTKTWVREKILNKKNICYSNYKLGWLNVGT